MSTDPNKKKAQPENKPSPASMEKTKSEGSTLLSARTIILIGIGLVVGIVLIHFASALLLSFSPPQSSPSQFTQVPPLPRLQVSPPEDMIALRATETSLLDNYGWINKQDGVAHIPVAQAMQMLATQGFTGQLATPGPQASLSPQDAGAKLFTELGCIGCHSNPPTKIAPDLHGVFGHQVTLTDGQTVTADENYVRESILQPQAKIVAGFGPIMPSFQGRVTDQQIAELIAYVQSLGSK